MPLGDELMFNLTFGMSASVFFIFTYGFGARSVASLILEELRDRYREILVLFHTVRPNRYICGKKEKYPLDAN